MKPWKYKAVDAQQTVHEGIIMAKDLPDAIHKLFLKRMELIDLRSISKEEYRHELMRDRLERVKAQHNLQNEVYSISGPTSLLGRVLCGLLNYVLKLFSKS